MGKRYLLQQINDTRRFGAIALLGTGALIMSVGASPGVPPDVDAGGAAGDASAAPAPSPAHASAVPAQVEALLRAPDTGWSAIWPGFDPASVPVALYDGGSTWLFRHPAPPAEFQPNGSLHGKPLFSMEGRHPAVTANASAVIGEVRTATLLLDRDDRDDRLRQILLHESFHVYQRRAHPHWSANEADLFLYPVERAVVLAEARLEILALSRAANEQGNGRASWAQAALEARGRRYAVLDSTAIAYERKTEWNEGTATYVEQTGAAWERFDTLLDRQYPPEDVRQRAYVSGALLCRALDFLRPGWRIALEQNDTIPLDVLLAGAIPAGTVAATLPVDSVLTASHTEIALLAVRNRERLRAMQDRPGYQLRIQSLEEPLFPERFDPLNMVVLEPGVVLHSRFVRLGNGRGSVEVFDWESLTIASGANHPLFAGVREISITGLSTPVVVAQETGTIRIATPPLQLVFEGATFVTLDSATIITLPGGP